MKDKEESQKIDARCKVLMDRYVVINSPTSGEPSKKESAP